MTGRYELKHPYIAVQHGKHCSYGGSQNWFERRYLRQYACGVIAGTDLILYLKQYPKTDKGNPETAAEQENGSRNSAAGTDAGQKFCGYSQAAIPDQQKYMSRVDKMHRGYFHVIPGLGMTGFGLAFGLNRYFRKHHWKLRAAWGLRADCFPDRMADMLRQDIPVIFSIGPDFPNRWSGKTLPLYKKYQDGYREVTRVNAHFVTATGMDEEWIRIASWGNTYYINKKEYLEYARKRSTFLFSNLIIIKQI